MNLRDHPVLKGDHYFHRLISSEFSGVSWSEGITSVSVGDFALDHLQHEQITKGKIPDPLVLRLEEMTQKYREGIRSIERGQCKLLKRLKGKANRHRCVYVCMKITLYFLFFFSFFPFSFHFFR